MEGHMKKRIHISRTIFVFACVVVIFAATAITPVDAATSGYGGGPDCTLNVVPPSGGFRFRINNGENVVYNRQVNLTMRGGSAAYMEIANNGWFIGSSFVPYATTTKWWLDFWPGYKTVYVRFANKCQQKTTGTISRSVYFNGWW
jgi:hypothetical protein